MPLLTMQRQRAAESSDTADLALYAQLSLDDTAAQAALSVLYRRYGQRIYTYCRKL